MRSSARKGRDGCEPGQYLLVVTGSIPTKDNGIYTVVGGGRGAGPLEEAASGAAAILALGRALTGAASRPRPNPTGAVGVRDIIKNKPIVNIAGCPPIGDVVTATAVHYLTFGRLPAVDGEGRPLFAYGKRIHDQCPRRAHFDAGSSSRRVRRRVGAKGLVPVSGRLQRPGDVLAMPDLPVEHEHQLAHRAGHPCIGCTEPFFWDTMTPFYGRLPDVGGFPVESRVDTIGTALAVGAAAGVAAHAVATVLTQIRRRLRSIAGNLWRRG